MASEKNKSNEKIANNRYTAASSTEESVQPDLNELLLGIMKDEFPDDMLYSVDRLKPASKEIQAFESIKGSKSGTSARMGNLATRNGKNVLDVSTEEDEVARYDLLKSYPTVDEDVLDDLIDEEWEYFEDDEEEDIEVISEVKESGLFLVNQDVDLGDIHDAYINRGPHNISDDEDDEFNPFCVFFILNGTAYPIPTYKTLEVMLVERGASYDLIDEATPEQIKKFDLLLDGETRDDVNYDGADLDDDDDGDISQLEEFRARSMPTRDSDWSESIRFRSGYRPKSPFVRDPGDYIKPENMRSINGRTPVDEDGNALPADRYVLEDPDDRYFDQVFQKQTHREKLREIHEGRMIIADWPSPDYVGKEVSMDTSIASDDAVLNLRMMINGHWKRVTSGRTMKLYAYMQEIDLADYEPGQGRYGPNGYIQLLIDGGGVTVVQPDGGTPRTNDIQDPIKNSDMYRKVEPLWNAFPHIVEADDDGVSGLDEAEYREYLDNFSNGGEPFDIQYLLPYEPPGSVKYYPKQQYQDLIAQAIAQEQIDAVKEQIFEIWPGVVSEIVSIKAQFDALPADYGEYVVKNLGPKSPLYRLMISKDGKWKYVKKKTWFGKDKIKTKTSDSKLFKVCKRRVGIKSSLNESQEKMLVEKYKWMKTVKRDKFMAWASGGAKAGLGAGTIVAAGAGVYLAGQIGVAAAAAATAAVEASLIASGVTLLPTVTIAASGPSFGALIGTLATNPITIGVAALAGALFLTDALMGEVTADEYDLPPWRFIDDQWYLKACILNEVDDHIEGFKQAADAADTAIPYIADAIEQFHNGMDDIDNAILKSDSVEEFTSIFEYLVQLQSLIEELNNSGLYALGTELKAEIDIYLSKKLRGQYNAIQYLRKRVYSSGNLFKKKRKYGLVWPKGPQDILNQYVPGCRFDNYVPRV
jgi:hypothetical protein|tara:strand:+ start:1241 stop:4015 length:2775 start_codon:yes stop_codon:yes gene_type:complete